MWPDVEILCPRGTCLEMTSRLMVGCPIVPLGRATSKFTIFQKETNIPAKPNLIVVGGGLGVKYHALRQLSSGKLTSHTLKHENAQSMSVFIES